KSRKTQLGMPDPAVETKAGHTDEGHSPADKEPPASPDLPVAPASGQLPPPGGEGLSLAGVAPTRNEPKDGAPASGPRPGDSGPARHALSLEERVQRLEDVVALLQLSSNAIHTTENEPTPAPHQQTSLADFIASAAQQFPAPAGGPPADPGAPAGERT